MRQISLLGMIYLPGTFLAVSCPPPPIFECVAHPGLDLLLNDLLQLGTGRKCSNDLAMARPLCGSHRAADLGNHDLVQEMVEDAGRRRKAKRPRGN